MLINLEVVTAAQDVVLATCAIIGTVVAVKGLNTWHRQLKGGVEYELSRRLLKNVYRVRNALAQVRRSAMWSAEMPEPPEEQSATMSNDERRHYGIAGAYQARWQKVADARLDLQTDLLEAEAFWGRDFLNHFEKLEALERELFQAVRDNLDSRDPKTPPEFKAAIKKRVGAQERDVLYDAMEEGGDKYSRDLKHAIVEIESVVRPHLKR